MQQLCNLHTPAPAALHQLCSSLQAAMLRQPVMHVTLLQHARTAHVRGLLTASSYTQVPCSASWLGALAVATRPWT